MKITTWYALKINGQISATCLFWDERVAEEHAALYDGAEVVPVDSEFNPIEE